MPPAFKLPDLCFFLEFSWALSSFTRLRRCLRSFSSRSGMDSLELDSLLRNTVAGALQRLKAFAVGDHEEMSALEAKFNVQVKQLVQQATEHNASKSTNSCM